MGRSILEQLLDISAAVSEHLCYQESSGLAGIPREELDSARRRVSGASGRQTPAQKLRLIREELGECGNCRLSGDRSHIVFGEGDPYADLMFVGEAPGADEDAQGRPFVGRAGQLLTDIIEKGMRLKRSSVYITNVVKCRPPQNRDPEQDEIEDCMPVLVRQVDTVRPKAIVALGGVASHVLTGTRIPITRLRGQWHEFRGIPLMPTYHPSYLLRNPKAKRQSWEDIKQVMEKLNIAVESGESKE